jgi:hypothetical protein
MGWDLVFRGCPRGGGFRGRSMGMGWFRKGSMGGTGGVQGWHQGWWVQRLVHKWGWLWVGGWGLVREGAMGYRGCSGATLRVGGSEASFAL